MSTDKPGRRRRSSKPVDVEPTVFHALLEVGPDGATTALVEELPGCFARAPVKADAIAKLAQALAAHLAWLRGIGEPAPRRGEKVSLEIAEEVAVACAVADGDGVALFESDLGPATRSFQGRAERLLALSRDALLGSVRDVPAAHLDLPDEHRRRPTFYGEAPHTIRLVLHHIAKTEGWLATRLETPEAAVEVTKRYRALGARARGTLDLLETMRGLALARLARLTDDERTRLVVHSEEAWTARKVIRRLIYHERLHARSIIKMKAALGL